MNSDGKSRQFCWEDLQPELLGTISDRLDTRSDIDNFRSTCNNWRFSTHPPPLCLSTSLPAKFTVWYKYGPSFASKGDSFVILPTSVFLLRHPRRPLSPSTTSETSWLVAVEGTVTGKLGLLHPFNGYAVNGPKSLCGFEAVELNRGATLRLEDGVTPVIHPSGALPPKVAVWDSVVGRYLMVLNASGMLECICSRTGIKAFIRYEKVLRFDDIVCWKQIVLAVDRKGRLYTLEPIIDLNSTIPFFNKSGVDRLVTSAPPFQGTSNTRKRLVLDSNGEDVYLVARNDVVLECKFEVFKLSQKLKEWEKVVSLGDKVLFITIDTCFFAWASDLRASGFHGNCIVFHKDCFPDPHGSNELDDILFRGVGEYVAVGVCKYGECPDFALISSLHGYSDLLWPPPSMIWVNKSGYLREPGDAEMKTVIPEQCFSNASSTAGLVGEHAGDEDEEVQTIARDRDPYSAYLSYGDEIMFSQEAQAGYEVGSSSGTALQTNVHDQFYADIGCNSEALRGFMFFPGAQAGQHTADISRSKGKGILGAAEAQAGELSLKINVQDQATANTSCSKGKGILSDVEAEARNPPVMMKIRDENKKTAYINFYRGVISAVEAQAGEQPRVIPFIGPFLGPSSSRAAEEKTVDGSSSTPKEGIADNADESPLM